MESGKTKDGHIININRFEIWSQVQSLFTQTWLKQLTMASTWPVNNFAKISEEMHILHAFYSMNSLQFKIWHGFTFAS